MKKVIALEVLENDIKGLKKGKKSLELKTLHNIRVKRKTLQHNITCILHINSNKCHVLFNT